LKTPCIANKKVCIRMKRIAKVGVLSLLHSGELLTEKWL
jgi:hypothetical protein